MIIGNGIAGTTAVEAIREVDAQGEIVVISDEDKRPYSRVALRQYVDGTLKPEQMFIRGEDFYRRHNVNAVLGNRVADLSVEKHSLTLASGQEIVYQKLLLATGARPQRPPIDGQDSEGVFVLNTWADADQIIDACSEAKAAVVVGGGFIGTEAAEALHNRGVQCSIVEVADRILPRMLDDRASNRVLEAARQTGIDVYLCDKVVAFQSNSGKPGSGIRGVSLESGKELPCDMVILATGVAPRLDLARSAGIKTNLGILVDDRLQTSAADVYAAGDVVETNDVVHGDSRVNALWTTGLEQGRVAGHNMAGGDRTYPGSMAANSLPVFGVATASIGCTSARDANDWEITSDSDRRYLKVVVRGDRLVGAVLVGDTTLAGPLQALIREREPVTPLLPLFERGAFTYAAWFQCQTKSCRL